MLLRIYAPTKYTLPETPKKNGSVEIGIKTSGRYPFFLLKKSMTRSKDKFDRFYRFYSCNNTSNFIP